MANTKKKTSNVKKDNKKEIKKTPSKKTTTKRKSYADEMKMDMSLQTKTTIMTVVTVLYDIFLCYRW